MKQLVTYGLMAGMILVAAFAQEGGVNKKKTGRELNGRTYDQLPVSAEQSSIIPWPDGRPRAAFSGKVEAIFSAK